MFQDFTTYRAWGLGFQSLSRGIRALGFMHLSSDGGSVRGGVV